MGSSVTSLSPLLQGWADWTHGIVGGLEMVREPLDSRASRKPPDLQMPNNLGWVSKAAMTYEKLLKKKVVPVEIRTFCGF